MQEVWEANILSELLKTELIKERQEMTLIEVLAVCGSYNRYIQIHNMVTQKQSGIMKVGNITYKQIDKYGYGMRVHQLIPCTKQGKQVLFINLGK